MTPEELRSFSELHPSYFFNTPILRACIPRSVRPLTEWRDDLRYLAPEKDTPRCWLCCRSRLRSAIASLTRRASTKSSVPHTRRTRAGMCISVSVVSRTRTSRRFVPGARTSASLSSGRVWRRTSDDATATDFGDQCAVPAGWGRDGQHERAAETASRRLLSASGPGRRDTTTSASPRHCTDGRRPKNSRACCRLRRHNAVPPLGAAHCRSGVNVDETQQPARACD